MKTAKLIPLLFALFIFASNAYAGDAATMIFRSGAIVYIDNGFKQLAEGMRGLKNKGSDNYPVEVNIENTTFYINLAEIALLCRDKCSSLDIKKPTPQSR